MIIFLFSHIFAQILSKGTGDGSTLHVLTNNSLTETVAQNISVAIPIHFVLGMIFAMVYAKVVNQLPGRGWKTGVVYSLGLWLLSAVVFFPVFGGGFFGLKLGAGLLPIAGSLVLHLAYGLVLGLAYNPYGNTASPAFEARRAAARPVEKAAAKGVMGGAVVGAVLAIIARVLAGRADDFSIGGVPLDFALTVLVVLCVGTGMVLGFWTGTSKDASEPNE